MSSGRSSPSFTALSSLSCAAHQQKQHLLSFGPREPIYDLVNQRYPVRENSQITQNRIPFFGKNREKASDKKKTIDNASSIGYCHLCKYSCYTGIQQNNLRDGLMETYIKQMHLNLRPATCGRGKHWEEMIPMRDGAKLQTLFYMPDTQGPWPVLFSRTPYLKNMDIYDDQGKVFTERGYGFIVQFCRGTASSEGTWEPFINEKNDGEDALLWLEEKPYIRCIGLYGYSYVAYTQWVLLDVLTPKVKTAYLVHFGTDRYRQMYCNGLFRHDIYTPWAKDNSGTDRSLSYDEALKACLYKPHIQADRAVWKMNLPWYREWITHPDYNDPFWKDSFWEDLKSIPSKVQIPVYLGCGWYDHHFGGMMSAYRTLSYYGKAHSRLVIGPWVHKKEACVDGRDTADAFASGIHGYEGALQWMDRCLKNGELPGQEVMAYNIGTGWKKLAQWPAKATMKRLWFTEDGLSEIPQPSETALCYTYDPKNIIWTHGAECMCYAPLNQRGSRIQPENQERKDRISLMSQPLRESITLSGSVQVHLKVSTDAQDTAFVVRLLEVQPDGRCYNIRTGGTTLLYRNEAECAQSYTPNACIDCTLSLWDILWTLQADSRLRVDIASSSFPEYNIHFNTAQPWAFQKDPVIAHQSVWIGGENGSYLDLPLEITCK